MNAQATSPFRLKDILIVGTAIVVLILLAQLGLTYLKMGTGLDSFFNQESNKSIVTTLIYLLQSLLFLLPLYVYTKRKYKATMSDVGFRKVGVKKVILLVLKAFGIVFLAGAAISFIQYRYQIEIPGFGQQDSHIPLFGRTTFDITLAVFVVGIAAPFVEETLFRGFLLQTLFKYLPKWGAALIVAALFALIHLEFNSVGILFFLGVILNWLYIKSDSVWPGIVFHVVNNLLAFSLEFLR